jgi:hypothetical protein
VSALPLPLPLPQCVVCKHFNADDASQNACSAFPSGIPGAILDNEVDHREPVDGDNGIQWAPISEAAVSPFDEWLDEDEEAEADDAALRDNIGKLGIPFVGGSPEYRREYARRKRLGLLGIADAPTLKKEPVPASGHEATEARMTSTPQATVAKLGGGVSVTRKVTLEDGTTGVFKPESGAYPHARPNIDHGLQTEREVAAWEVAKAGGYDDLVAPTVARTLGPGVVAIGGDLVPGKFGTAERGSFQEWQDGKVASKMNSSEAYGTSDLDVGRAAMYDHLIGNTDRHSGNWMVGPNGKLRLIDHGLAFPERPSTHGNYDLLMKKRGGGPDPHFPTIRAQALAAAPKIEAAMRKSGLKEASITMFRRRVEVVRNASNWYFPMGTPK